MKNLQGKEAINRMLELMGKAPINENIKNSVVELTKVGPDGKVYGIVRENHEYYIKIANATDNLVVESFDYIGGLSNKKNEAYSSYSKAIKQLNLKFMSLNESIGKFGQVNVFLNDNLINEHHPYKADQKLSATKGMGDGQEYVIDEKGAELTYKAKEGKEESQFGDNVAEKDVEDEFEKVKLSENELAIDSMITGEETEEITPTKKGYSISRAINEMDSIIDSINVKSKVETLLEGLTTEEMNELTDALKKKV
jgi:hypothetical protein